MIRLTRRHLLAGTAALAVCGPARADADQHGSRILHVLPDGMGGGGDWDDPAGFGDVADALARGDWDGLAVGAPTPPLLWKGRQIRLDSGGTAERPLDVTFTARGARDPGSLRDSGLRPAPPLPPLPDDDAAPLRNDDAAPLRSEDAARRAGPVAAPLFAMDGNRTGPGERPDVGGKPFLVLGDGASHLRVTGPALLRAGGAGFVEIDTDADLRDLSFVGMHASLVGRAINARGGSRVTGLTLRDCTGYGLIRGFARFRHLDDAVFENCDFDAALIDGGGGSVCQVISVTSGRNLRFTGIRVARAVNELAASERGSEYIQGDGIVLEEDTEDAVLTDCHAQRMGDGGFDLKTRNVQLIDCSARDCKLGFRIWSRHPGNHVLRGHVSGPVSKPGNGGACLWIGGSVRIEDTTLEAAPGADVIRFGRGFKDDPDLPHAVVRGGRIQVPPGAQLAVGSPGLIDLENVALNGETVTQSYRWTGSDLLRA